MYFLILSLLLLIPLANALIGTPHQTPHQTLHPDETICEHLLTETCAYEYPKCHGTLPSNREDDGEGVDAGVVGGIHAVDLGVLMDLLKGLGLQEPPVDNNEEGVTQNGVERSAEVDDGQNGAVKSDMSEILATGSQEIQTGPEMEIPQDDDEAELVPSGLEGMLKMFGGGGAEGDNSNADDVQGQPDISGILSMLQNPEIIGLLESLGGGNGVGGLDGIMGMFGSNVKNQAEDQDEDEEDEEVDTSEDPLSRDRLPLLHNNPVAAAQARLGEPEHTRDPIDPESENIPTEFLERNAMQAVDGTQLNAAEIDEEDEWVVVDSSEMEDEWVAETPDEEVD